MIDPMEITECIQEDLVKPCYKKTTWSDANRAGHSSKMIGETASSNNYPKMSDIASKGRKRYVYHMKYRPKATRLIHGSGHSSDERKVLGDFGSKYSKSKPTQD